MITIVRGVNQKMHPSRGRERRYVSHFLRWASNACLSGFLLLLLAQTNIRKTPNEVIGGGLPAQRVNPLHLPEEILSLVGHHHGQGELYVAFKSSMMSLSLFSTVNRK